MRFVSAPFLPPNTNELLQKNNFYTNILIVRIVFDRLNVILNKIYQEYIVNSEYLKSIPLYLILTILTCGLFNLYWNYTQMKACNDALRREEFNFILWILLSIITCFAFG